MEKKFILILKPENQWGLGNYAEKSEGRKIYLSGKDFAKTFRTEEEATKFAGVNIGQFDIEELKEGEHEQ